MSTPNPSHAVHKQPRVLACVLCQHRKIKCDRNTPCANCIKANAQCTPSTPAPARKRRRPNHDLVERLARCEELLKKYATGSAPPPGTGTQTPPERLPQGPASEPPSSTPSSTDQSINTKWPVTGKVVQEESGVHFMDSYLWATVFDELQAMKDIVETDEPDEHSILGSEDHSPENHSDLLFPAEGGSLEDLLPDSTEVFRLWQLFLDRVNPVTKIIHVPTVQPYVIEALTNMENIPLNYQALLFSIYAMAIASLTDKECMQTLAVEKEKALRKYGAGVKRALSRYNFLKNHDMAVVQALVFYMYALSGRYDKHASWIISGTVLRIAQKMGYHRDGDLFNLNPYETEMRRRIWYQILLQDAKAAVSSGLSHGFIPSNWDTKEPSNLNDADLIPGSSTPVPPREGPTEMGFCILMYRIANLMLSTGHSEGVLVFDAAILADDTEGHRQVLQQYQTMVSHLEKDLEEAEKTYIDVTAGSAHAAAVHIRTKIVKNLKELLVPMREQPEWGTEILGPKDNMFKVLIMNNEHSAEAYKDMSKSGFLWFAKLHIQLDVFAVMTGFLCQRPLGLLADRAWECMDQMYLFADELMDLRQKQYLLQAQLTLKAWKAREQAYARAGKVAVAPHYVTQLQEQIQVLEPRRSTSNTPTIPQQPELEQFLSGYTDVTSLNWDLWGDLTANHNVQIPLNGYVRYDDTSMNSLGIDNSGMGHPSMGNASMGNTAMRNAMGSAPMGTSSMGNPALVNTSMGTHTLNSSSMSNLNMGNLAMNNLSMHNSPMCNNSPLGNSPMEHSPRSNMP